MRFRLVVVLVLLLTYPTTASSAYAIEGTFTLLNGDDVALSIYEGQFILIDGFATWCAPCELQMEYLHDVHEVVADQVEILSISFDRSDTFVKVQEFKDRFNADWTFGIDQDQSLNQYLKVEGYPTTFLIDENGLVLKKWLGLTDSEEILLEMDKYLDLPGSLGRQIAANELVDFLISSPFFVFFMIVSWMAILLVSIRTIRLIRENRT